MKWMIIALCALAGLTLIWMTLPIRAWLLETIETIGGYGAWGILIYFALYFCLATASFPTTPLNIGAGLIFHFSVGFFISWAAGGLASAATFLLARHFAHSWAERKVKAIPKCEEFLAAVDSQGFKMVLLARLNPFLPAALKNFGFGLTSISFWKYALATLIGQIPIVLTYVYLGWAGSATLLGDDKPTGLHYAFIGAGIILSISMLFMVNWYGRKSHIGYQSS